MKVLLTGAEGQVGREFPDVIKSLNDNIELIGVGRNELDITNKKGIQAAVEEFEPDIIVNAAAYTAVDKAEQETGVAFAVNRDGAANLAAVCVSADIPLIQISTDYVFDGNKEGEYLETDAVSPMSVYGESKLEGEQRIQEVLIKHIILRTSWVFGPYGKNFVYTIIRLAKQKSELTIVDDQTGCPTSAQSIARAIVRICEKISKGDKIDWGVYHFCGSPATNWYEFSKEIVKNTKQAQLYKLQNIRPISTRQFPTPAVRPQNSVMNCNKISIEFGIEQEPWIVGLRNMIDHPKFIELTSKSYR